jgi:hypothetical protein
MNTLKKNAFENLISFQRRYFHEVSKPSKGTPFPSGKGAGGLGLQISKLIFPPSKIKR